MVKKKETFDFGTLPSNIRIPLQDYMDNGIERLPRKVRIKKVKVVCEVDDPDTHQFEDPQDERD